MTFEEARSQFPVLQRIAYLNAGTFGPLAKSMYSPIIPQIIPRSRET